MRVDTSFKNPAKATLRVSRVSCAWGPDFFQGAAIKRRHDPGIGTVSFLEIVGNGGMAAVLANFQVRDEIAAGGSLRSCCAARA